MSHYKPYPAYKDSGVEWLRQVPEHWRFELLTNVSRFQSGKAHEPFIDNDGDFICVNSRFVSTGGLSQKFCTQNLSPACVDDILMVMSDLPNGRALAKAFYSDRDEIYAVNQRVCIISPIACSPRFLFYLLDRNCHFLSHDDGINQTHLPNSAFTKFRFYLPPSSEQQAIALVLDRETARIDALIEKKTRFIELLREKRQALITHAVTKGLDPSVKMKDSGVEWLGEVPEHWVCKKLMYWMDGYGSGTTPSKDDDYCMEGGLPWVTTGELREVLICETDKRVTDGALSEYSALKAHPVGSLVIAMYGATVGRLGLLGVPAALNQACFAIHPCKTISVRMLRWWFEGFRAELIELATGAGQPNISGDKIRNLFIAAPLSLAEQEQIADQIESRTLRIDGLVSKTERSIELLKERRSAMITAAVTGQIDLREAV